MFLLAGNLASSAIAAQRAVAWHADRSPSTPLRPSPAPITAGYNLQALQRGTVDLRLAFTGASRR